jgi:hypothetical protein
MGHYYAPAQLQECGEPICLPCSIEQLVLTAQEDFPDDIHLKLLLVHHSLAVLDFIISVLYMHVHIHQKVDSP